MPKKRRGRPPGSKNKKKRGGRPTGNVAKMDVAQLSNYIAGLRSTLATKIEQQRAYFESQLAELGVVSNGRRRGRPPAAALAGRRRAGARRKPEPKYQSKKDLKLKWTGRGMLPVWMRDEMKGTKLKKENFLIK